MFSICIHLRLDFFVFVHCPVITSLHFPTWFQTASFNKTIYQMKLQNKTLHKTLKTKSETLHDVFFSPPRSRHCHVVNAIKTLYTAALFFWLLGNIKHSSIQSTVYTGV